MTSRKLTRQLLACLSRGARQERQAPTLALQGPTLGPAPRTYYTYSHEPFHPLKRVPKWQTADEAVAVIKSGDTVFLHGAAATPALLVKAMTRHGLGAGLRDVTVCHIHTDGEAEYTKPECEGIFRSLSFFIGANCRKAVNEGRGDYVPIFLSEIPMLFHRHIVNIDVALVHITLCKHGL